MEKILARYLAAKAAEEDAKQNRLTAEAELIAAVENDKLEGTKTVVTPNYKVSVSNKLTRALDHDAYLKIRDSLPKPLQFLKYKPEIDLTKLRHLEAVDPSLLINCITIRPGKPSITIKEA